MLKSQVVEKMRREVERLQGEARMKFFDRMMYEINDSLTSILAITDVEPKDAIPKIKRYIHRINRSLQSTKTYQTVAPGDRRFEMAPVIKNLVDVIEANYKNAKVVTDIADLNAPVLGDQTRFERFFFTIVVDMLQEAGKGGGFLLECRQKDQFAQLSILKDNFSFSPETLDQIHRILEEATDFKGRFQVNSKAGGVEVILKIPLQFQTVKLSAVPAQKEPMAPVSKKD